MLWGQRICKYPNEYAPELLEAMDEYSDEDNPGVIDEVYKKYCASGEFSAIRIIESRINSSDIEAELANGKVEMTDIRGV
jgi:hypothetical protein